MKHFLRQSINLATIFFVFFFHADLGHASTLIDRVVAIAGNEVITQSELDRIIRSRKDSGNPVTTSDQHWSILRQLIEEALIAQEAQRRGIRVTEEELQFALKDIETRNRIPDREALKKAVALDHISWSQYLDNLRNQLSALKLLSREVNASVRLSDEAVKSYYESHPEIFGLPDRVRLTQILLAIPSGATEDQVNRIKEKAEKIYDEARSGTIFSQLVQQYSEGREKKENGDLGFFKKGDLTKKIDQLIFSLKEGEITPPIQTPLGIHLFKIEVQELSPMRPFEGLEHKIKERLILEKTATLRREWISDLWQRSFIEIK